MTTNNVRSTKPRIRSSGVFENRLKNSTKYNFRLQSAPPLSIQHFLRYSTGVIIGAEKWNPSGKYKEPIFHAYLSPEVRKTPVLPEPIWKKTGPYREKPPTSLSPEKRVEKRIHEPVWKPPSRYHEKRPTSLSPEKKIEKRAPEPVWQPVGKIEHKPVPFFDPPNLRWSLQELRRSMPELRPKPFHATRSTSNLRRSAEVRET